MTPELRQRILDTLWPPGEARHASVWAVLDCARDPAIYRLLLESRLEFLCLYSGKLPRELEMVAPHMVELLPARELTMRLLEEGWGRGWGSLAAIDDASALRPHLRRLLRVQDEDGRRLLFRYYDPRVLRGYLPTCRPSELLQFFGPVRCFVTEDAQGDALVEWRHHAGRLASVRVPTC